jgi:hypothetical protein
MKHNNEYIVRMTKMWNCTFNGLDIESGNYEGSGYYQMIHADNFEEAIEKWNNTYCPEELKRLWGECGLNESLVMVLNHKGQVKYYM